jgi:hypothetical protein
MNYSKYLKSPNLKLGILLFVIILILFINLLFVVVKPANSAIDDGTSPINTPTGSEIKTENRFENMQTSFQDSLQEESCGDCHEGFNPFEVEVDVPNSLEPGSEFDYEIIVTNTDSNTPHLVEDLEAALTGLGEPKRNPFHNQIDDSITRFQSNNHGFPVEDSAYLVTISLAGDDGLLGRNNIDLSLTSPNGQTWRSNNNGADEEIILDLNDLADGGTGEYSIGVQFISGIGSISYSITIDILYVALEFHQFGDDLSQGESHTFSWRLTLTNSELESMGGEVSGTVSYEHDGGNFQSYRYIIEITPGMNVQNHFGGSTNFLLENGRIIGFLTLAILILIIINGFSKTTRKVIAKKLRIKDPHNVHCLLSLSIIVFAIIHALLLISGPYSWDATPNVYGSIAVVTFGVMAGTGLYRKPMITKIGKKNWKWIHRILTIVVLMIVFYHFITFGGHFN